MAEISTKQRKALPSDAFAGPNRTYPVPDKAHADNAMARLEQQKGSMSPAQYASIKAKIRAAQKRFGEKPKAGKGRLHVRADLAAGGSLHVSHHAMSDRTVRLDGVAVTLADDGAKPVWIQLAKQGTFRGHPAGPFTMSSQTFHEIVRNFNDTQNRRIPVDYEHASEADPTQGTIPVVGAPAQGWIVDMKVGDDGNLYGLVEWGTQARDQIRAGQYRYFSPAIRFGAKDRVTGQSIGARMTSGALTNNPFLDGMKPLAAKDAGDAERAQTVVHAMRGSLAHAPHEYMPGIKAALRMPELCSARECSEMLERLRDHFDAAGGDADGSHEGVRLGDFLTPLRQLTGATPGTTWEQVFDIVEDLIDAAMDRHELEMHPGEAPPSDAEMAAEMDNDEGAEMTDATQQEKPVMAEATTTLKDLETANATLSLQLKDATTKVSALESEVKTLRDEAAKRAEKDVADEVDLAFATYKDAKKLSDADKANMLVMCKAAPEAFRAMFPKVAPEQRHLQRNLTDKRTDSTPEQVVDSTEECGIRMSNGRLETMSEHTSRLMKEKGLSFPAAQNLAIKQRRGIAA